MQVLTQEERTTRDFAVTVFIVQQGRVALLYDELAGTLAAPSGHIRLEELPAQAAARVALAQTGMPVELILPFAPVWASPFLARPEGLLLEAITLSHEHISLVYFARPATGFRLRLSEELPFLRWFDAAALEGIGLQPEIAGWASEAISRDLRQDRP
ncbi:MAG: NUDIX domain-containing protein [Bacillota bacterium]|nr:NUDIX domain-containing protein [Bacillota bacterium]